MASTVGFDGPSEWDGLFDTPPDPADRAALWYYLDVRFGLRLAARRVCRHHQSPYDIFYYKYKNKPHSSIVLGPRGGGKSMMAGVGGHLQCRWHDGYRVNILGGSKLQSAQVYRAMADIVAPPGEGGDNETIEQLMKESVQYHNGSEMRILTASRYSVRGPHVPHLIADEIDDHDPAILSAAVGMVQEYPERGFPPIIEYLSTYHNVGGNMADKIASAEESGTPFFSFCIFEVMEKCPDSFSGPNLEHCPKCPIYGPCWADRLNDKKLPPRAKVASGHYTLKTVLSKTFNVTPREFDAEYLCLGPKAEGTWFRNYHDALNVDAELGEYDPHSKVYLSIDYGVCTGAVFFQVRNRVIGGIMTEYVAVFAEYYAEGATAAENAAAIKRIAWERCQGRIENVSMDSAANSREGAGTTGRKEYYNAGFQSVKPWRKVTNKKDDLDIIDTFVLTAAGTRHLFIHTRCTGMRNAMQMYRRAKVGHVWTEKPADTQHPWEEFVDALAGGLHILYPFGRSGEKDKKALKVSAHRLG